LNKKQFDTHAAATSACAINWTDPNVCVRYEHKRIAITANAPFSEWTRVFPDKAMTVAAVDRLVHHATILEVNVESYRRLTAPLRRVDAGQCKSTAQLHHEARMCQVLI